jgi:cell division septal protein FtsQ
MAAVLRQGAPGQAVATDKRFRRAHVKPARKRSASVKHVWLVCRWLALVTIVGYGSYRSVTLIGAASSLQISHMTVRGHERLSTGEVLALVDGLHGQNILSVSLDEWQTRLLSSPWVESATIRRVLPSTVEIVVHERRPMGIGRLGSAMYLIDARGVLIDEYGPSYADIDLPVIDGLAGSPRDGGSIIDQPRAEFAARVIGAIATRPDIAKLVSSGAAAPRRHRFRGSLAAVHRPGAGAA